MKNLMTVVAVLAIAFAGGAAMAATNTFPPDGNVGIGTLSPTANLDLYGVAPVIAIRDSGLGGYTAIKLTVDNPGGVKSLLFKDGSATRLQLGQATGDLSVMGTLKVLGTGNSSIAGKLGIGTTGPAGTLHVKSTSAVLTIESTYPGTTTPVSLLTDNPGNVMSLVIQRGAGYRPSGWANLATIDMSGNLWTAGEANVAGVNVAASISALHATIGQLSGLLGVLSGSPTVVAALNTNAAGIAANLGAIQTNDADISVLTTQYNDLSLALDDAKDDLQDQIDAKASQADLDAAEARVADLEGQMAAVQGQIDVIQGDIASLRQAIADLALENGNLIQANTDAIAQNLSYIQYIEDALSKPGASGISRYQRISPTP